jgi:hypothetical protein
MEDGDDTDWKNMVKVPFWVPIIVHHADRKEEIDCCSSYRSCTRHSRVEDTNLQTERVRGLVLP